MNRLPRLATTALISGALAAAVTGSALALGAGTAAAQPNNADGYRWCPGQALPEAGVRWDETVCA